MARAELVEKLQSGVIAESLDVVEVALGKVLLPERQIHPIDVASRTPDLLGEIPQINPKPVSLEAKQEDFKDTSIDIQESPAQLEELYFKQPEESLSIGDTYHENGVIEEAEQDVDTLLAELEEAMQQVGSEYMGKLLVRTLADVVETDQLGEQEDIDYDQIFQAMLPEAATDIVNGSETLLIDGFEKEFNLYLESLEPEQAETTKNVIEKLSVALKESQQLSDETTDEAKETAEQRLEELCKQLVESISPEYDEEIIEWFMQSITTQEPLSDTDIEAYELSIDELKYLGTHEYKHFGSASLLVDLAQFIKQKMQPRRVLGRYALQVLQPSF